MAPHGRRLDEMVLRTAARILEATEFQAAEIQQLRLAMDHGGCGLRSAADRCQTVFLAAVLRLGEQLDTPDHAALCEHGLLAQAATAQANLKELGVTLDKRGMPYPTEAPPASELDLSEPSACPMPKRQRAWWICIDTQRAAQLSRTDHTKATRIRSCSGPEGELTCAECAPTSVAASLIMNLSLRPATASECR